MRPCFSCGHQKEAHVPHDERHLRLNCCRCYGFTVNLGAIPKDFTPSPAFDRARKSVAELKRVIAERRKP